MPMFLLVVLVSATLVSADVFAQAEGAASAVAEGAEAGASTSTPQAEKAVDVPGWLAFLGRLHVVVLHLPIGLLLGAFILEFLGMFRRSRGYDIAVTWTLFLGAVWAAVAIAFGIFLEETTRSGDYDALTMSWHKWLGIAMGGLALIAFIAKVKAVRRQWQDDERGPGGFSLLLARLSLIGVAVLLPAVGHIGGSMSHDTGEMVKKAPFEFPSVALDALYFPHEPPAQAAGGPDAPADGTVEARWVSDIQPIMDQHCTSCHGSTKQKAGLRLDSLEAMIEGGEYGPVLEQGRPELSRLYQVVCLHPDDDYFMPPGKPGLDLDQMRTLALWITDSIDLGKAPPADADANGEAQDGDTEPDGPAYDAAAVDRLRALGADATPQYQGSDTLIVSFANQSGPIAPEWLAALEPIADAMYSLDLSGSGITDADLGNLPNMPELRRLYLKDTAVTDAGLAGMPSFFSLNYLNLFGTQVTDASIDLLAELVLPDFDEAGEKTPGQVYLSETGVTLEGVQRLRDALGEDVEVVFDDTVGLITPDPGSAPAPGDEPDATAEELVMVNTICPVSGADQAPADPEHTLVHDGRLIGFCCENCKGKFAEDPAPFLANLP